jgi:hypothetical protein
VKSTHIENTVQTVIMRTNTISLVALFSATLSAAPLPNPQGFSVSGPLGSFSYDNRPGNYNSNRGPPPPSYQNQGGRPGEFIATGPLGTAAWGSDGSFYLSPSRSGPTGIQYTPPDYGRGRGWAVDTEGAETESVGKAEEKAEEKAEVKVEE